MTDSPLSDSWVEIPTRPSSESLRILSLRLPQHRTQPDDRPSRRSIVEHAEGRRVVRATSAAGSSQDEYEESSSESDHVLGSSNEDIARDNEEEVDLDQEVEGDDDNRTALSLRPPQAEAVFTPQPNAFSHPPISTSAVRSAPGSYFPPTSSTSLRQERERTTKPHLDQRRTSGSYQYQPDHDAALRASLTTLLSCAAAVRPKPPSPQEKAQANTSERITTRRSTQPSFRLVSEAETRSPPKPQTHAKRRSRESSKDRLAKKQRTKTATITGDEIVPVSPTIAGWIISAGIIVAFSAISFSAGYYMGRIDGRIEGQAGVMGGSCGREVIRGTRSTRWLNSTTITA